MLLVAQINLILILFILAIINFVYLVEMGNLEAIYLKCYLEIYKVFIFYFRLTKK